MHAGNTHTGDALSDGIGTIVGAGSYVLVGKVAGEAGMAVLPAFLVVAVIEKTPRRGVLNLAERV